MKIAHLKQCLKRGMIKFNKKTKEDCLHYIVRNHKINKNKIKLIFHIQIMIFLINKKKK